MAFSMRNLDPALQGAGQKGGIEIWRIESFKPVPIPKDSYGKFFTGDSYIVLKTTASKSGALHHDIHYWLGKDTSQDEAGAAAVMTVELDAALGGRAVQYREVQGHETEKFLSYFKPCIIPQEGGAASGFKHVEPEEYQTRLYVCKGKHVVHVKEVPFARSTLNHDDVFILDTQSKIFQFNGSNSSIQERAKALEVVQYIKDTYHDGKCDIAAVEDGKLMADAEAGEFWGLFGGFAPLPRKTANNEDTADGSDEIQLSSAEKGQVEPVEAESLQRELLDTNKCYILDCGLELFVWMGRSTSVNQRKSASESAEELLRSSGRPQSHIIRVMEGFETVMFRSKFDSWPETSNAAPSEQGRGRVAALLQRQGVDVKGLIKTSPSKDETQPHIDGTGNIQVWHINGEEKILLQAAEQSKFYSGDCYIFQYSYPGEDREEYLVGTWFGKQSVEEDRAVAVSMASKMVESMKFMPAQARIYEGKEPIQFFVIMQSFITLKGGISDAFKKYIAENEIPDNTYDEEGIALFRIQGSGPENMQAIQTDPVASGLNSSHCYILHSGSTVFTWCGNLTSSDDQELMERMLDLIKPNVPTKLQKEGSESEQFWELLSGKTEYPSQMIKKKAENDPHLFSCTFSNENLKVTEIFNFTQDDLMTEDIFILDCHTEIFIWVGQQVDPEKKTQALAIGEKFLEHDFLLEKLPHEAPIYIVTEGNEPPFFTRFFTWDSSKSAMHGNSFQRKLAILKNQKPVLDKKKRRGPVFSSRSSVPDKPQARSRSVSFSPDRVRMRGRSPAFNALAANFENPSARNLSTPPPMVSPMVRKLYPKSIAPVLGKLASTSSAIAARTALFEKTPPPIQEQPTEPGSSEVQMEAENATTETEETKGEKESNQDDVKGEEETEEEIDLPTFPYERLTTNSEDPLPDIDVTKREAYLSLEDFTEKFEMTKKEFYKLPKWKQNKLKMSVYLF
ncbi:PREDICTED: villin-5 isoform X2 [Tarenaya hassleriana]|uniref:villin-5 isoform X2 n=1 Tax=Tarenaya hassleriana TaxID=28532 RepID=UPI00053C85A3|nr:PREDICTED: villin-5 isoform X2 [Tarenaya hassleriana]